MTSDFLMRLSRRVERVDDPPIDEALNWLDDDVHHHDAGPFFDLAQAAPNYPPPEEMRDYLADEVRSGQAHRYTAILGLPELRRALAEHMSQDYNAGIQPQQTAITAGCNQAFTVTMKTLAGPGDEVVLVSPYYFNHKMWLDMEGVKTVLMSARAEDRFIPLAKNAEKLITPLTKAIVVVSPGNPTGATVPAGELKNFYDLAKSRGIVLVLDETYKDFRHDSAPAHDLFNQPDWQNTLVQLYSFSKVYSLAGYRVGSVIASETLLSHVAKVMDCVAISAPHIGQLAALYGLRHLDLWRLANRGMVLDRQAILKSCFEDVNLSYQLQSVGAYFAYVKHPFIGVDSVSVAKTLARDSNLLCLPGSFFDPDGDKYLRFSFANLEQRSMLDVMQRLISSQ